MARQPVEKLLKRALILIEFQKRAGEEYYPVEAFRAFKKYKRSTLRREIGALYRSGDLERVRVGRWFKYYVEEEEEHEPLLRWAWGLQFPLHTDRGGGYYGAIIEAWSRVESLLSRKRESLKGILRRALTDFTKSAAYASELIIDGEGEGIQEVEESEEEAERLEDTYEWRIEEESAGVLSSGDGDLESA